ncbi:SCO family protein [Bosea massiliensis]|jgi:protein SCO1/2|uniref:SCO family protein n=1 Tax=Bosea massiliensis TaxID=151419 RepID=A0ABW0P118_9HYPH
MQALKWIRYGAWAAVAILVFVSAAILIGWWQVDGPGRKRTEVATFAVGGPFTLVNHKGETVTEATYLGKPTLVFFGFTHCPEVCPTTLFEISNQLGKLGPDADRLQVLFVTVDPERDTPAQMALYLQSFDSRIIGLSGTQAQVDTALSAYKVHAKRIETESGYTMDHTASVYLMDAKGRFKSMIDYHEDDAAALEKIRLLLNARG